MYIYTYYYILVYVMYAYYVMISRPFTTLRKEFQVWIGTRQEQIQVLD